MSEPRPTVITGTRGKFRDSFADRAVIQPNPDNWLVVNESPDGGNGEGHLVQQAGDTQGASYLLVSLSPFVDNSSIWLSSQDKYQFPLRTAWGISQSQRVVGQEVFFGLCGAQDDDPVGIERMAGFGDFPIPSQNVTIASNVGTITSPAHGLQGGDRVLVLGALEKRLNVGPVQVTVVDKNTFTIPITLANGSYATGTTAMWRHADPASRARNAFGMLLENGTVTNATLVTRRNGSKYRLKNVGTVTSISAQSNTNPYSDAFLSPSISEQLLTIEEASFRSWVPDGNSGITGTDKYQQNIPDEDAEYRLHVRVRSLDDFSKPIAQIVSFAKAGTTTATVTTDRPHGLLVGDRVGVYGARNQGDFPATSDTNVVAVPSATTFTVVLGASTVTLSDTNGGSVHINHGGILAPGVQAPSIQTVARVGGVLQVVGSATWGGMLPGDRVNLWGLNGAGASVYDGAYRVLRLNGATLELDSPGADFGAIVTGGTVIRRTDVRLHFVRMLEHTRQLVEITGGRGNNADGNNAVPVAISSAPTLTVNANGSPVQVQTAIREQAPISTTNLGVSGSISQTTIDTGVGVGGRDASARYVVLHNTAAPLTHGYLVFEQSTDGTTYRETHRVPVPADNAYHSFEFPLALRYYRARFLNGAVAQTAFFFSALSHRSEPARDLQKNLLFPLTVGAGIASAANAVTTFPVLDLGTNHQWETFLTMLMSDQGGTASIQQSIDGSNWITAPAGAVTLAALSPQVIETPIWGRYLRIVHTNGATAAVNLRAALALKSL